MKALIRYLLPLLVLALAVLLVLAMIVLRERTHRAPPRPHVEAVEVAIAHPATRAVRVHGSGEVIAAQQVSLVPQVSGALTWISPQAVVGGRLARGEVLARIDDRDYEIALRAQRSAEQQAALALAEEEARVDAAAREWALLGGEGRPDADTLASRQPQLEAARLAHEAAVGAREKAELDLSRTRLRAPFDAVVTAESVDLGQVVGGASVATLVGTEVLWVEVPLTLDDVARLDLPGASATVSLSLTDGTVHTWPGTAVRLHGELDPSTRTAVVVVEVPGAAALSDGVLPLLPGAWVDVDIKGRSRDGIAVLPREALRESSRVWIVDQGDALARRTVGVAWSDPRTVGLTGLDDGDRVVVSPVSVPVEGTPARVVVP